MCLFRTPETMGPKVQKTYFMSGVSAEELSFPARPNLRMLTSAPALISIRHTDAELAITARYRGEHPTTHIYTIIITIPYMLQARLLLNVGCGYGVTLQLVRDKIMSFLPGISQSDKTKQK